ncbi:hypothetical protein FRC17_008043, partial [Serendipita sp. 399]
MGQPLIEEGHGRPAGLVQTLHWIDSSRRSFTGYLVRGWAILHVLLGLFWFSSQLRYHNPRQHIYSPEGLWERALIDEFSYSVNWASRLVAPGYPLTSRVHIGDGAFLDDFAADNHTELHALQRWGGSTFTHSGSTTTFSYGDPSMGYLGIVVGLTFPYSPTSYAEYYMKHATFKITTPLSGATSGTQSTSGTSTSSASGSAASSASFSTIPLPLANSAGIPSQSS